MGSYFWLWEDLGFGAAAVLFPPRFGQAKPGYCCKRLRSRPGSRCCLSLRAEMRPLPPAQPLLCSRLAAALGRAAWLTRVWQPSSLTQGLIVARGWGGRGCWKLPWSAPKHFRLQAENAYPKTCLHGAQRNVGDLLSLILCLICGPRDLYALEEEGCLQQKALPFSSCVTLTLTSSVILSRLQFAHLLLGDINTCFAGLQGETKGVHVKTLCKL